jgi:hypothetical protein
MVSEQSGDKNIWISDRGCTGWRILHIEELQKLYSLPILG